MDKVDNLIALANDELNAENYSEAERLLNDALREDRERKEAWLLKTKVAYFLNRGLSSSYQYLTNAYKVNKNKEDIKDILDTFSFVSLKELKWYFSNAIERMPDADDVNSFIDTLNIFNKEGGTFLSSLGDNNTLNNVKNEFIKYSIVEFKKLWKEVANEYYKNAINDYGKRWFDSADYNKADYRPGKYEFEKFTESCSLLVLLSRHIGSLANEECDYDSVIDLLELCITILNCFLNAFAFETKYEAYTAQDYAEEEYEGQYSAGGEYYWSISLRISQEVKNKIIKNITEVRKDIITLQNNKKAISQLKKQKELEEYWSNHQEEAAQLMAQKDATNDHKKHLQEIYDQKNKELLILTNNKYINEEEDKKISSLNEKLEEKKKQLKELGLFKFKEKSLLKDEINKLNNDISKLETLRHKNKADFFNKQSIEIEAKKKELLSLQSEIQKCNDLIASINRKFTGE